MSITVEDVKSVLPSYRYNPIPSDNIIIQRCLERTIFHTKSFCNIKKIPKELEPEVVRMACGEFLYEKKKSGGLADGGIEFPKRLAQVTEGDTSLSFTGAGKEDTDFDDFIDDLRRGDIHILEHFRRVHW